MKDPAFIKTMLQKGKEAKDKAKAELSNLSSEQINWKASPPEWSIGQCLDHLRVSDSLYYPMFEPIVKGNYRKSTLEKWSPLSWIWGRMLVNQVQENVKIKSKAPKRIIPTSSGLDQGIVNRFHENHDIFYQYVAGCDGVDIDRVIITSPTIDYVTYHLRHAIQFLTQHKHRHINQAIRVKTREGFPQ